MGGRRLVCLSLLLLAVSVAHADPRSNYLLHCSGCHRIDGNGVHPLVPSLHNVLGRIVALPNGRSYLVRVPGASQAPISDAQLAQVVNWILTEFNGTTLPKGFSPLTADEVGRARRQVLADPLKYREQLWRDVDE